jgi:RND family efflux transporter MFP subunit
MTRFPSANPNDALLMMNTPIRCLLVAVAAAALTACSRPQPPPLPVPQVTVSQPQVATVTNWDEYPGHLEAVEMVELRPRVSGYLDSIHFRDGAEVKAGELLFVIDPKPYQAELERAQAERQRAETRCELAGNDLKRAESLRGTRAISDEELDSRSKAAREAEAALASAKATESATQLNLDYTRVKAPISGKIGRRLVTVGNLVQGGGGLPATVLATLVTMDPIYCYFDADERAFLKYRSNGSAGNGLGQNDSALACELRLDNEEGYPHPGRVDFFDNQVDRQMGTIRLRGVFSNPDRALVPGLFAKVRVPAGPPVQALLIPDVAVSSDQGRKYVYVVNQASVVEPRPIKAGRHHGTAWSVLGGLTTADRVVVNGLLMLRPGIKVEVTDGTPGAAEPKTQARQ